MKTSLVSQLKFHIVLLIIAAFGSLALHSCRANTNGTKHQNHLNVQAYNQSLLQKYSRIILWLDSPWTDDDQPYAGLRKKIDTAFLAGITPKDILSSYKTAFTAAPQDPIAQFGYYYSYDLAAEHQALSPEDQIQGDDTFFDAFADQKHPQTYNFARIGFLLDVLGSPNPQLKDIGMRLFQKDPKDEEVATALVFVLANSNSPTIRTQAESLAHNLVGQYPNEAWPYKDLGYSYYRAWYTGRSNSDKNQSIAAFEKFLDISDPNANYRKSAQWEVDKMTGKIR